MSYYMETTTQEHGETPRFECECCFDRFARSELRGVPGDPNSALWCSACIAEHGADDGPYTPAGFEAFVEFQNTDHAGAARALRVYRRDTARDYGFVMRIVVAVYDTHPSARWDGEDRHVDECEVYGWRAALATVRGLRMEWAESRYRIAVGDPRLHAASDRWLDADATDDGRD